MADQVNLIVDQGATFVVDFQVIENDVVLDLTGYTAVGKARKFITSNTAVTFNVQTFSNGIVRASLTALQTNNMSFTDRYLYNINLTTPGNTAIRIVEGTITVTPQVAY